MASISGRTSASVLEEIAATVQRRFAGREAERISRFMQQYHRGMPAEVLLDTAPSDLYGAALSHWNFAAERSVGEIKIRVYNPEPQRHGWQSSHTVIDVVVDDRPFLVDSLNMALDARGLSRFLLLHPILLAQRDEQGRLLGTFEVEGGYDGAPEAWMHFEVPRQSDRTSLEELKADLESVLNQVAIVVNDWKPMLGRLDAILNELAAEPPDLPQAEIDEGVAFLEWIREHNFSFLGYREYEFVTGNKESSLCAVPDSGLGILRNPGKSHESTTFGIQPERKLVERRELLIITKSNARSSVHRPGFMDHISIKHFDEQGRVCGERRFVGLYTSTAYNRSVQTIPVLRLKVEHTLARAKFHTGSHAGKTLLHLLETFPRDELFNIDEDTLFETAMGILELQERQRLRVFIHGDRYGRTYSCLVYIPRERYNPQARDLTRAILEEEFQAQMLDFSVQVSESTLARLYFLLRISKDQKSTVDVVALEARLQSATRSWNDELAEGVVEYFGEDDQGMRLLREYGNAFNASYRETYPPRVAVRDIEIMRGMDDSRPLEMILYRTLESRTDRVRLKLFHLARPISLSDALPMLENMGLTVHEGSPSRVDRTSGAAVWVHDFDMAHAEGPTLDIDEVQRLFHAAYVRIWHGDVENDGLNRLVLRARLSWQEIVVLRAYAKYMKQVGVTYSQEYMQETLVAHPRIVRRLIGLFHARFRPDGTDTQRAGALHDEIVSELEQVSSLDEDRIVRSFLSFIEATLRTNYYQTDSEGQPKPYLSLKIDPSELAELPQPRPAFEIFVYSPRVEGVHLRGGLVARGGLRWSDRREDFRTEVLGLMKAQTVKNTVIVPVGSKGGFVPKQITPGGDRATAVEEAKACYRWFIRGLLDVTDNLIDGTVVAPPSVVRYDGDDPYLVVAADKGTATFSDIANDISAEYGFWLGDAFASGGSAGYDHKAMGITARGAWESVKRHFREMGFDTQTTPFTVVGIGDMSGDVFGNGMLLSDQIRLVGAFNHLHIFLDPDPDPTASFAERKRLFDTPGTSWADYDTSLISDGGGVFPRSAKAIKLTPQVQRLFGVEQQTLTPNDVIRALLKARVELLWNGGIGTYVKATREYDAEVGDRANDAVRVNGADLKCRVVAEGGNLGLTQLGRIEFANSGGRVHTDAIDNSAGVDCSDHEVNIKILLDRLIENGDLTCKQRDELLAEMTDEVAALVIRNNYLQTQALSLAAARTATMMDVQSRLIDALERDGELVRSIEFLPDNAEIEERKGDKRGLTLPELATLMGYVKLSLYKKLLASDLVDLQYLCGTLVDYFPMPIRKGYRDEIARHPLAREIICTLVTNELVNRSGATFLYRLTEETGATPADIARAYVVAREIFGQRRLWDEIERLDNAVPTAIQLEMLLEGRKLVERAARWFVRNRPQPLDIEATIDYFAAGVAEVTESLASFVGTESRVLIESKSSPWIAAGVPEQLAVTVAGFNELLSALDVVDVASYRGVSVEESARVYYELVSRLNLHWLRDQINALPSENRWQALGREALRDDLYTQQRAMTSDVLKLGLGTATPSERIDAWLQSNALAAERCKRILQDVRSRGSADFTMLSVALREIRGLRLLSGPAAAAGAETRPAEPATNGESPRTAAVSGVSDQAALEQHG